MNRRNFLRTVAGSIGAALLAKISPPAKPPQRIVYGFYDWSMMHVRPISNARITNLNVPHLSEPPIHPIHADAYDRLGFSDKEIL